MPFTPLGGAPTLSDYQFWFGGLAFGGIVVGAPYNLQKASGLDMPALRGADADRPREQGEYIGLHLLKGRDITLDIVVIADSVSLQHSADALNKALTDPFGAGMPIVTESPLYIQMPGRQYGCMARLTRLNWNLDFTRVLANGYLMSAQFHCTDPRLYATPTVGTNVAGGGTATVNNTGTAEVKPVLFITGAATSVSISNTSLAGSPTMTITNPLGGSITVGGDTLSVDLDAHAVALTHSGVFSVHPSWVATGSIWWDLPPGANVISFTGATNCQVAWAPGYLSA